MTTQVTFLPKSQNQNFLQFLDLDLSTAKLRNVSPKSKLESKVQQNSKSGIRLMKKFLN